MGVASSCSSASDNKLYSDLFNMTSWKPRFVISYINLSPRVFLSLLGPLVLGTNHDADVSRPDPTRTKLGR